MKQWHQNLIGSIVVDIIGTCLILWGFTIEIPDAYRTFFGIPTSVNPEYRVAFLQMLALFLVGILISGVGLGMLLETHTIYQLEKKLASGKAEHARKKCSKCGMEYSGKDYEHCPKCGTKLEY
ncbi:zinc ribbon domain-containing protein [Candidatus Bathyarchaeota archaeon]|nr:MAG: zinc ribbon domain-containing protein [Candidatus Bathyarchaeota archaeon]